MPSHRQDRLNSDFRREISAILGEMKDPRLDTLLSVTRVDVTSDLSYAKVYIGSLSGAAQATEACAVLKKAAGHVRSELAKVLRIRKIPELIFIPDDSVDYYNRINTILEGLKND
ncbi:MAG: 30S ribosome-binding factor RbfA [Oscillospiraceae bacterium]|nr:30S ribosome-binding factor RbfA [Oscillospiraceae bacterium]